jgi:hypothetical protein
VPDQQAEQAGAEDAAAPAEAPKRRGPKPRAEIEAEIRAQVQEELAEQMRAQIAEQMSAVREEIRSELQSEFDAKEAAAQAERAAAAEANPISAAQVDGDPNKPGSITVNFVDDGLTLLGRVWYRGEELTINPDTEEWDVAYPVLTLTEDQQIERWKRRMFRPGTWSGKRLDEIEDEVLTPEDRAALAQRQAERDSRYGALSQ